MRKSLILPAVVVALLYVKLLPFSGTGDVDIWLGWMASIGEHGVAATYAMAHRDYPPGSVSVLALAWRIATASGASQRVALKITIALFTIVSGVIFVWWSKSALATIVFLAAIALNGVALGYLDVLVVPPLLLAFIALERRHVATAGFLYAVALAIKWQPLVIAPFVFVEACQLSTAWRWRVWIDGAGRLLAGALVAAGAFLLVFDFPPIRLAFILALGHNSLSFQGFNFNWIVQTVAYVVEGSRGSLFDVDVPRWVLTLARVMFDGAYGILLLRFILQRERRYRDFLWFSCVAFFTYCMFSLGVHENHLFLAMVLAFGLLCVDHPAAWPLALYLTVASNLNLYVLYGIDGHARMSALHPFQPTDIIVTSIVISAANAVVWLFCFTRRTTDRQ